jgi:PEP-CTERM motif
MRTFFALTAALAIAAAPTSAAAQLNLPANVSNTPVTARIGTKAISTTYNGAPGFSTKVGPLQMTFGGIFGSAIADMYCVDLNNSFYNGQNYTANITLLSSSNSDIATRTRQGMSYNDNGGSGLYLYLKMAWLADKFSTESQTQWAGIQGAIWHLESRYTPLGGTMNPNVQFWLDQVVHADLMQVNRNGWAVVTDVNVRGPLGGAQEFLVRTNVVPEPSTYALMITGFAGLAAFARRRSRVA